MPLLRLQHLVRPAPGLLNNQVNEVQLGDDGWRQDERVEVGLAHAPRQLVEHPGQFDPGVDE